MPEADPRFHQAIDLFNRHEWYAAHDVFEEIWHETADLNAAAFRGSFRWPWLSSTCNGGTPVGPPSSSVKHSVV